MWKPYTLDTHLDSTAITSSWEGAHLLFVLEAEGESEAETGDYPKLLEYVFPS